jgi:hypothetical protein
VPASTAGSGYACLMEKSGFSCRDAGNRLAPRLQGGTEKKAMADTMAGLLSQNQVVLCAPPLGQMARLSDSAPGGWGAEYSEASPRAGPEATMPTSQPFAALQRPVRDTF